MGYKDKIKNRILREIVEWSEVLIIAFVLAMIIKTFIIETTEVSGISMNSTLLHGEKLLVNRFIYDFTEPKRGDIIVFLPDNTDKNYIKRVIALPGEVVDLKDGEVYIDGEVLEEDYLAEGVKTYNLSNGKDFPYTLSEGEYLAFGDNRGRSLDCRNREIGTLTKDKIRGKAICRIYPFDRLGVFSSVDYNIDQEEDNNNEEDTVLNEK